MGPWRLTIIWVFLSVTPFHSDFSSFSPIVSTSTHTSWQTDVVHHSTICYCRNTIAGYKVHRASHRVSLLSWISVSFSFKEGGRNTGPCPPLLYYTWHGHLNRQLSRSNFYKTRYVRFSPLCSRTRFIMLVYMELHRRMKGPVLTQVLRCWW